MKLTRLGPDRYRLTTSGGFTIYLTERELADLRRQIDPELGSLAWVIDQEMRRPRVGPTEFKGNGIA